MRYENLNVFKFTIIKYNNKYYLSKLLIFNNVNIMNDY
jgi:hypothetical protein